MAADVVVAPVQFRVWDSEQEGSWKQLLPATIQVTHLFLCYGLLSSFRTSGPCTRDTHLA